VYRGTRVVFEPYVRRVLRVRVEGLEHVPSGGPLIVAPNHFSWLDHFIVALHLRGRRLQFMAKSELFRWPLSWWLVHVGAFPVRRGIGDSEAFATARTILARGDGIVIYPEGGRARTGQLGRPLPGVGRVALQSGAPVVPTAVIGSDRPRRLGRRMPTVLVRHGPVLRFERVEAPTREQARAAAARVFDEVARLYDG
jgi:1-acyl-sn-glycerol-3-phosphate acyltransferase